MIRAVIHILALALLSAGTAVNATEEAKIDAKALFERKCIQCHSLDRARTTKKTEEGWKETVMRMKKDNGASISDEEAMIIMKYLSENYGEVKPVTSDH